MSRLHTLTRQNEPADLEQQVRALKSFEKQPAYIAGQQSRYRTKPVQRRFSTLARKLKYVLSSAKKVIFRTLR